MDSSTYPVFARNGSGSGIHPVQSRLEATPVKRAGMLAGSLRLTANRLQILDSEFQIGRQAGAAARVWDLVLGAWCFPPNAGFGLWDLGFPAGSGQRFLNMRWSVHRSMSLNTFLNWESGVTCGARSDELSGEFLKEPWRKG